MALTITDTEITSDEIGASATSRDGFWYVTSHPDKAFDRNQAITAMTLAELEARGDWTPKDRLLAESFREELR
jgi:hypothetical protein